MATLSRQIGVLLIAWTGVLLSGACAPNPLVAQGSSGCLPADTVFIPMRLEYFRNLVSSTAPSDSTVRTRLGIPKAASSKVSLVTSRNTCVSAVNALNTKRNEPNAVRLVWVFALGAGDYAVEDPQINNPGEWRPVYIYDRRFTFRNILYGW
jgi:hypothetical protein